MTLQQKQILSALLIGCLIGAAAGSRLQKMSLHRFWEHGPDTQRALDKFTHELELDSRQQDVVKSILNKHHEEMMALQKDMTAKFDAIRMSMRSDMKAILNPDQQKKFQVMTKRWDADHPHPEMQPQR